MATASKIHLTRETTGDFQADGITEESARVASELLQVRTAVNEVKTSFAQQAQHWRIQRLTI